jgi:hypothetical protein
MVRYKGYLIVGRALSVPPAWWRSEGSVFTNSPEASNHIKQVEGVIFESKQAAEAHGLELCKKWIAENLKSTEEGGKNRGS